MRRIYFSTWGTIPDEIIGIDGYAIQQDDEWSGRRELRSDAVRRSIGRRLERNGYYLGTWRSDGIALSNGEPSAGHYTFVVYYGHGNVAGQGWVAIYNKEI